MPMREHMVRVLRPSRSIRYMPRNSFMLDLALLEEPKAVKLELNFKISDDWIHTWQGADNIDSADSCGNPYDS